MLSMEQRGFLYIAYEIDGYFSAIYLFFAATPGVLLLAMTGRYPWHDIRELHKHHVVRFCENQAHTKLVIGYWCVKTKLTYVY